MLRPWTLLLLSASTILAADQPWKDKQAADWSNQEAQQVLNDSPWAKTANASLDQNANRSSAPARRGGGGAGGIGMGIPGMGGIGRRGGMGGGGNRYPRQPREDRQDSGSRNEPPTLRVRWESALPVRAAELKTKDTAAPEIDANHYAIAIYGVPKRMASGNRQDLAKQLKKQAALKRDGKKELKPSSVEVLQREDGPVVVYLFPRSKEITKLDSRLDFNAHIGRLKLDQSFYTEDMHYQGKLEL